MSIPVARAGRPWASILVGGGIAALLDIVYAILRNGGRGRSPEWVLQSVASGLLGERAFEGGAGAAALGLGCHVAILLVAAFVYLQASLRLPLLRTHAVACGLVFGVLVYLFMNFVVLPASAFPFHLTYPPLRLLEGFASHAVFVGLPIALAVRHFTAPRGFT
jgi:hypothetical protein